MRFCLYVILIRVSVCIFRYGMKSWLELLSDGLIIVITATKSLLTEDLSRESKSHIMYYYVIV